MYICDAKLVNQSCWAYLNKPILDGSNFFLLYLFAFRTSGRSEGRFEELEEFRVGGHAEAAVQVGVLGDPGACKHVQNQCKNVSA